METVLGLVFGVISLSLWWSANQKHIEETGFSLPSKNARARIRRNARQKGISEQEAHAQWVMNKQRRRPATFMTNEVLELAQAPSSYGQPVVAGQSNTTNPSNEPIAFAVTLLVVALVFLIAVLSSGDRRTAASISQSIPQMPLPAPVPDKKLKWPEDEHTAPSTTVLPVRAALNMDPSSVVRSARVEAPPGDQAYISGRRVPLRENPQVGARVLDRLSDQQGVRVIERQLGWSRVRDQISQREGWVQDKRLVAIPPSPRPDRKETQPARPRVSPALSTASISKLIIARSASNYAGSCACPYSVDRAGRSCGSRSAYSRPGGAAPICYAKDVTPQMIASHREALQAAASTQADISRP